MDGYLFFPDDIQMESIWPEDLAGDVADFPVVGRSAFAPYRRPGADFAVEISNFRPNSGNIHKRMIGILRSIPAGDGGRSHRHMMVERQRREKMKQSYTALHSLLPPGTKFCKNSIVQTAAAHLQSLRSMKAELQQKKEALETQLAEKENNSSFSNVRLSLGSPSSAVDSMIESLKCLKSLQLKAVAVNTDFSCPDSSAALQFMNSNIPTTEVEKTVEGALMEAARKFRFGGRDSLRVSKVEGCNVAGFWEVGAVVDRYKPRV